jgi:putative membrane protein
MTLKILKTALVFTVAILGIITGIYALISEPETSHKETYSFSSNSMPGILDPAGDETSALKSETVYVLLDHDGQVIDQRIVNRIYGQHDPDAALIVDYGRYLSVENMVSPETPIREDNRLLWNSSLITENSLYYEGVIDNKLPVSIGVSYFLEGEPIEADELSGKSGKLDIVIRSTNNLIYEEPISYYGYDGSLITVDDTNYVPFLVQGTVTLDLKRFSNIEAEDSVNVITGQSASINFMAFPYPDAETTISMDGVDIEIGKLTFILSPGMPPLPEIDIEEELVRMLEGMALLNDGLKVLSLGAEQLLSGLTRFQEESSRMAAGTDQLMALIGEYRSQEAGYRSLVDEVNPENIAETLVNLRNLLDAAEKTPEPAAISEGIENTASGVAELAVRLEQLNQRITVLENTNSGIRDRARQLVSENEPGSDLYELGIALTEREDQLDLLLAERSLVFLEMDELNTSVELLQKEWEENYLPGTEALEQLAAFMENSPGDLLDRLSYLTDDLSRIEDYYNQIDQAIGRAEEMLGNLSLLPGALEEMIKGQTQLRDGITRLRESGILTMERGLIDGINESRFGAAKIELMHRLADDYRSYADNDYNRYSEVQFILQMDGIDSDGPGSTPDNDETESSEEKHWAMNLWAKLLDLFS